MLASRSLSLLLFISLFSGTSFAAAPTKHPSPLNRSKSAGLDDPIVTSSPDKIEAGKDLVPVVYTLAPCDGTWGGAPAEFGTKLSGLLAEGITIAPGAKFATAGNNCTLTLTISISKHTPAKAYPFSVKPGDIEGAKMVDLTIVVVGPALPARGPIPTASPEVDVMWAVMPDKIVKDNYGRMVADRYYGIEVVIGNNSGYDLQIAGVGFKFGPRGPFAELVDNVDKAIASDHNGLAKDFDGKLKAAIQACDSPAYKVRKESDLSLAECVSRETRRLLNQLDNELAASAEVARRVRANATELSRQSAPNVSPSSSYQVARGTASRGHFWDIRNLLINGVRAVGPMLVGSHFFFGAASQLRWQQWTNLLTNPLPEGVASVIPDERLLKLQRLDDQLLRDGKLISNNRQDRSRVLIPKKLLGLKTNDPVVVTRALGELVIIGNQIQFVNRISVTTAPTGEIIPPPTVVDYNKEFLLGTPEIITITGTNLGGAEIIAPDKVRVEVQSTTKNEVKAQITPDRTLEAKPYVMQLKTPAGLVPLAITLKQPPPGPAFVLQKTLPDGVIDERKIKRGAKEEPWIIKGEFLRGTKFTLLDPPANSAEAPVLSTPDPVGNGVDDVLVKVTVPNTAPARAYVYRVTPSQTRDTPSDPTVTLVVEDVAPEAADPPEINVNAGSTVTFDITGKFLLPEPTTVSIDAEGWSTPTIECSSDTNCRVTLIVPENLAASRDVKLTLTRANQNPTLSVTKTVNVRLRLPTPTPTETQTPTPILSVTPLPTSDDSANPVWWWF